MDQPGGDSEGAPQSGLIDTDVLIDAARNVDVAVEFVERQRRSLGIRISVVSAMELVAGSRNARELRTVTGFLAGVTVEPLSPAMSVAALRLMESHVLAHGLLIPDALIAATAIGIGLPLFTRNVRHFEMIASLDVRRPYSVDPVAGKAAP